MINLELITPQGKKKDIETSIINVGSIDGQRGIIPGRVPYVLMLDISILETIENGQREKYSIGGGTLYFEDNKATCLLNSFEAESEIDFNRAEAAKERAEERINSKNENIDLVRAEAALKRALNRLSLKK